MAGILRNFDESYRLNNNVSVSYASVRDNRLIKEAKDLARSILREAESNELISVEFSPDFVAYVYGYCNNYSPYGEGGAAYLILDKDKRVYKCNSKGFKGTTNNKMELMAILSAVASVPIGTKLLIFTSSRYCMQVLSNKFEGKDLSKPNTNIIQQYFNFASRLDCVRFVWLNSHSEDKYFDKIRSMARLRAEEMRVKDNIPKYDFRNSPKCMNT